MEPYRPVLPFGPVHRRKRAVHFLGRTARYRIYLPETGRSLAASGLVRVGLLQFLNDYLQLVVEAQSVLHLDGDFNRLTVFNLLTQLEDQTGFY